MLPAAFLAWAAMSMGYLQLFPDRLENLVPYIGGASVLVLILAWGVASYHAWRVSSASPITALRYE